MTSQLTPRECCGKTPEVFEMRAGHWAVHCDECWEGTDEPHQTAQDAVSDWNAQENLAIDSTRERKTK